MVMVLIIIVSFANYFFIANKNIIYADPSSPYTYYDQYVGIELLDVFISIYLLGALGSFNSALYTEGPDKTRAMIMFLLATLFICVVFMNMLIAIMGETFAQVSAASVESGIREQVVLIADHAWLLDLSKIFKGKKYIIRV